MGGNYCASVRHFMENEVVIRSKSLTWWSGYSAEQVHDTMVDHQKEYDLEDKKTVRELILAVNEAECQGPEDSTKAALGHIAGYLARSATLGQKCHTCADVLVDREAPRLEVKFDSDESSMKLRQSTGFSSHFWTAASSCFRLPPPST